MTQVQKPSTEVGQAKIASLSDRLLSTKVKVLAKIILSVFVAPALLYGLFFLFLHYQSQLTRVQIKTVAVKEKRPVYWLYNAREPQSTGHLKHVIRVLERLGFERGNNESAWDLLWAHDYPFKNLYPQLYQPKPHQLINHFPGCGYITNKVDLSTSQGPFIPKSFKIPEDKDKLLDFVRNNPEKTFVQKSNAHRGIKIQRVQELNLTAVGSFVQEFIERPYLVDGFKFDIGIYTVVTSIDPLRVYAYKGDVLFRFCPVEYYPFDAENVDKYVVGDDYLPIWNVPSLKNSYTKLGLSMKESFDTYVRSTGKDPQRMWDACFDAIKNVLLQKEAQIRDVVDKRFRGTRRNFFELVRFDFTVDENLDVFMMEANMSPNLSSAHYPPNQLLYEQVLYNLFSLIGLAQRIRKDSLKPGSKEERDMVIADKNLVVLPQLCSKCDDCFKVECQLCRFCFTDDTRRILTQTYWEHQNKMDYLRIFPPVINKNMVLKDYSLRNQLLVRWFQGKCELDPTWCN